MRYRFFFCLVLPRALVAQAALPATLEVQTFFPPMSRSGLQSRLKLDNLTAQEPAGQDGHSCQWIAFYDQLCCIHKVPEGMKDYRDLRTAALVWLVSDGNDALLLGDWFEVSSSDSLFDLKAAYGEAYQSFLNKWDYEWGNHETLLTTSLMLAQQYGTHVRTLVYDSRTTASQNWDQDITNTR